MSCSIAVTSPIIKQFVWNKQRLEMLLVLILKAAEGANGTIIYSSKLLFLCDHSTIRDTVHSTVSSGDECMNSFIF